MADVTLSLVIPIYNAARHLEACLASVAAQTFGGFECLCVDDGSTDGSAAIVHALAARDRRFTVVRQANAGCSAARNRGMGLASAPYLAFLDADDLLHPQAFEVALALIERHRADLASFGHADVPDDFALSAPMRLAPDAERARVTDAPFSAFFKSARDKVKGDPVEIWLNLYRRAAIGGVTFTEGIHFAEDVVFVVRVMHAIRRRVFTPTTLLFHRDNPASAINQGITERYLRSHAQAGRVLRDYFAQQALDPQDARLVTRYISYMLYKSCVSQPLRKIRLPENHAVLACAQGLARELASQGLIDVGCLGLRKRLATRCFLGGHMRVAKRLV
jgi:glycosyltransferase involved in cell wall biosynthesis